LAYFEIVYTNYFFSLLFHVNLLFMYFVKMSVFSKLEEPFSKIFVMKYCILFSTKLYNIDIIYHS